MYLCSTLVLRIIPGFGVCLCLSQLSQLPVQPKKSTFVLGLEGIHSHLQFLFALFQLFHLLTELLFGICRQQMQVSLRLTETALKTAVKTFFCSILSLLHTIVQNLLLSWLILVLAPMKTLLVFSSFSAICCLSCSSLFLASDSC